ncbi:MAG: hypothetical protein PHF63_00400 [Herbinix sp.]|nr:hypothetical protein [Herbinix sp.]
MAKKEISKETQDFLTLKEYCDHIKRYCDEFVVVGNLFIDSSENKNPVSFSMVKNQLSRYNGFEFMSKTIDKIKKTKINYIELDKTEIKIGVEDETFTFVKVMMNKPTIDKFEIIKFVQANMTPFVELTSDQMAVLSSNEEFIAVEFDGVNTRLTKGLFLSWRQSKDKADKLSFTIIRLDDNFSYLVLRGESFDSSIYNFHIYKVANIELV